MASVVFNPFKQRFINGEVPSADTWNFIPVNRKFKKEFAESSEYKLEQLRDINDFKMVNSSAWDDSLFQGMRRDLTWYKPVQTSGEQIPMFITSGAYDENGNVVKTDNWSKFKTTEYFKDVSANNHIQDYLEDGGFYYLRSKEELRWFANHVNTENNCVNGVLGDSIEGVIQNQVGASEAMPFQGVLDGNGYTINGTIICDNDDNGLVGILGENGVVRNFRIKGSDDPTLICKKTINLNHIKNDGRDINAGILVGRNYGTVENIDASDLNKFTFSGFVPQVYSVTNKSDEYTDFGTIRPKYDNGENFFFLNSWCVNSPGNICPYVGYFAEGIYAEMGSGYENRGKICCREYSPKRRSEYDAGVQQDSFVFSTDTIYSFGFFNKYAGTNENILNNRLNGSDAALADILNNNVVKLSVSRDPLARNMVLFVGVKSNSGLYGVAEIHGTASEVNDSVGHIDFNAGHINPEKLPWFIVNDKYCDFAAAGIETDYNEMTTISSRELITEDDVTDDGYVKSNGAKIDLNAGNALGYGNDVKIYLSTGFVHFGGVYQKYTDAGDQDVNKNYFGVSETSYSVDEGDVDVYLYTGQTVSKVQFDVSSLSFEITESKLANTKSKLFTGYDLLLSADIYATFNAKYNDTEYSLKWKESELNDYLQTLDSSYFGYWAGKKKYILMPNHAIVTAATPIIPLLHVLEDIDDFVESADGTTLPTDAAFKTALKRAVIENLAICTETVIDTKVEDIADLAVTDRTAVSTLYDNGFVVTCPYYNYINDNYYLYLFLTSWRKESDSTNTVQKVFWTQNCASRGVTFSINSIVFGNLSFNSLKELDVAGSITFNRIDPASMFYRPFLHANAYARNFWGNEFGLTLAQMRQKVTANWATLSQQYATIDEAVSAQMHYIALTYIQDPRYYGLDRNGNWTAQSVRESDWLEHLNSDKHLAISHGKYDPNQQLDEIHYNWNLEKAMMTGLSDAGNQSASEDVFADYDKGTLRSGTMFTGRVSLPREIMGVPLRMPNMGRVAYNISPVVGANYGTIQNVSVKGVRKNLGNFVGFIGGVAGKQERGQIQNVFCDITDDLEWFREEPKIPEVTDGTNAGNIAELAKQYNDAMKQNNFHVRYKMTPLIPGIKTELLNAEAADPAQNPGKYRYFPAGIDAAVNEDIFPTADEWTDPTKLAVLEDYLNSLKANGIRVYRISDAVPAEVAWSVLHSTIYSSFRENPDYKNDIVLTENSQPAKDFCAEWYTDSTAPEGLPTDDVITFKLRPIFNAGGVFGRIIPDTAKTNIKDVNVKYDILTDSDNKDFHCAFGSLAGLIDMQTTQLGQSRMNRGELLSIQAVNAVSNISQLNLIGFIGQQFNENVNLINNIYAGFFTGPDSMTTWAIDTPNATAEINMKIKQKEDITAPTNHASVTFYGANETDYAEQLNQVTGWVSEAKIKNYTNAVISKTVGLHQVKSNSNKVSEYAPNSLEVYVNSSKEIKSPQSVYGSNTSYLPSIGVSHAKTIKAIEMTSASNVPDFGSHQEMIGDKKPSKLFFRDLEDYTDSNLNFTSAADFTKDMIPAKEVFQNKDVSTDIYFSYSYNATDTFVPDWTFKHNVQFNSAIKTDELNKEGTVYDKLVYGYTFSDDLAYPGDGFDYEHNYLHLGNSISPSYLRKKINENGTWQTSAVSAVMPSAGKYVAADDDHQFGGILVTDSYGRNVMFIDNTDNADLDNLTYNVKMPAVHLNDTSSTQAGMLLEVK